MTELTVSLSVLIAYGVYFYAGYSYIAAMKDSSPEIGTWGLFSTGTFLAVLSSFVKAKEIDVISNVTNVGDFLMCATILGFILSKRPKIHFDTFDKFFFSFAGCIVVFWIISEDAVWANGFSQALITLGYWPTIKKARKTKTRNEPDKSWILFLVSASFGVYPAIAHDNMISLAYCIRTIALIPIMLFIIRYYAKTARVS